MICTRCHRPLYREPKMVAGMAFGPKCYGFMVLELAAAPKVPAFVNHALPPPVEVDERQVDLFKGAA